eukprot:11168793-Alexandrium_andersonii.AAC.1
MVRRRTRLTSSSSRLLASAVLRDPSAPGSAQHEQTMYGRRQPWPYLSRVCLAQQREMVNA